MIRDGSGVPIDNSSCVRATFVSEAVVLEITVRGRLVR